MKLKQQHRPITTEPPCVQANHVLDEKTNQLKYEYNGFTIISIQLPPGGKEYYRRISDGNIQSNPFIQQLYLALDEPHTVRVRFELSGDALNMRPRRAGEGEAILGQCGRPTLYGANGLYDVMQDLLIDWHGAEWRWACDRIHKTEAGNSFAEIDVEVGLTPWIINLRMQYYRKHLNYAYHKPWERRPDLKPVAGWCSWEAYRSDIREEHVMDAARFVSEHFKAYGLEYMQLDDGYQLPLVPPEASGSVADAWLTTNEKFPSGHAGLVSGIKAHGLKPGIWTNAVVTNPDFASSGTACVKGEDGNPIKGKWIQYVLDCTPETLAEHVAPYYKGLKDAGYTYFKTDAIRHLIYDGLHEAVKAGVMTGDEAEAKFRDFLECAREQIGEEAYLLSCWGVLSEAVGLADACRVATDANPSWPAIRMQLVETARWFHTHRILFMNDPDHVCVRAPQEWAQSAISLVSLTGGLLMISDKPEHYDDERIKMVQRNLPPLHTVTAETGPLDMNMPAFAWTHIKGYAVELHKADPKEQEATSGQAAEQAEAASHPFSTLWAIHMQTEDRSWCVAGRFATEALQAASVETAKLGLAPDREYVVFDFWEQQYLGRYTDSIPCRELEVGSCQLLAVRPVNGRPMLIASSRHVSMDLVSVQSEQWQQGQGQLTLKLEGVAGTSEHYWIYVPDNFAFSSESALGAEVRVTPEGETVRLEVHFEREESEVTLAFTDERAV
ncbi:alpha-galactosidase [Paenibacillus dokdonensis]|uniref:Alpha-galactosidase n=1 Tax=Paenibacillus dokdonensis TaxID=2567944 RepID=A0ABU6GSJ0_9BACL|nr:alpha-galactosidase [Paenibacillus dokdonensis]MEC0241256.1 alpha-galactosidase [Paenibacillus dokdonensis]